MRRRRLAGLLAGVAATGPFVARAQAPMPVVGFLHSAAPEENVRRLAAFHKGLGEAGFVEGRNVAIEPRWARGQNGRLAEMAADLVARKVTVIATLSSTPAAVAAKKATNTIPIYFVIADPPVDLGLVSSLGRPGGNATGIVTLAVELVPKRLELLRQVAPQASTLALLIHSEHPSAAAVITAHETAARALGVQPQILQAVTDAEIDAAFATLKPGSALLVGTDATYFARRARIIALANRGAVPTMFDNIAQVNDGGFMSYGPDIESLWVRAGVNVGRILKGEKPANLPVEQPTKFALCLNLRTARAIGLEIPSMLRQVADEVIE
jgi:putative ABC transport system substrate-binding protein